MLADYAVQACSYSDLARIDSAIEELSAWKAVQAALELQMRDVPTESEAVLPWLLDRAQTDNIGLLTALLSVTIYRVRHNDTADSKHLDRLGQLVELDMAKWWEPTAESYLGHISKDRIAAVVTEAVGEEGAKPLLTMKKGQVAEAAEKLLAGPAAWTLWASPGRLPVPLMRPSAIPPPVPLKPPKATPRMVPRAKTSPLVTIDSPLVLPIFTVHIPEKLALALREDLNLMARS